MRSGRPTATRVGTLLGILTLALLVVPPASVAAPAPAPPPLGDSVTGSGMSGVLDQFEIDARSGPSGENPTGQVTVRSSGSVFFNGTVTCLAVRGNVATLNIQTPQFGIVTMRLTDNVGTGAPDSINAIPTGRSPGDCSPFGGGAPFFFDALAIVIVDAPPLPTSKEQCRNGGWAQFGFRNQGQCIRFVRLIPGPLPYPTTKAQCRHGGWAQYGFKNKRKCLRFVRLTPNRSPSSSDAVANNTSRAG